MFRGRPRPHFSASEVTTVLRYRNSIIIFYTLGTKDPEGYKQKLKTNRLERPRIRSQRLCWQRYPGWRPHCSAEEELTGAGTGGQTRGYHL